MNAPRANDQGSFENVISLASEDWPYAMPQLYAVNIVSDPGIAVKGWSASPDGENVARNTFTSDRSKVELIGFWHGEYKITEIKSFLGYGNASHYAREIITSIPTKFFMENGKVVEENGNVQITGDWPLDWDFAQIRDVGVFLCFLQMLLISRNKNEQAQQLKDSITPAWPSTEIVLVFQQSLQLARKEFLLDNETRKLIDKAQKTVNRFLKG